MTFYNNPRIVNDEALSIAGGKTFQVIQLADSEGGIVSPGGSGGEVVLTWNRPANTTAYIGGDVVGDATSAVHRVEGAGASDSQVILQSAALIINNTTRPVGMTGFQLRVWSEQPQSLLDNAQFTAVAADRLKYGGVVTLPTPEVIGGGFLFASSDYVGRPISLSEGGFWFNLVTVGGYGPGSATEYSVVFHTVEIG